jgi:hypothetical protein
MDLKRKTQLRNLLTAYRNEICEENIEEYGLENKCGWCEYCDDGAICYFDTINLRIENELWEG